MKSMWYCTDHGDWVLRDENRVMLGLVAEVHGQFGWSAYTKHDLCGIHTSKAKAVAAVNQELGGRK